MPIKPYYEHAGITIYHGDCLEILPDAWFGGGTVVITDPPYNVGIDYGAGTNDSQCDLAYERWSREWFAMCRTAADLVALTPGIVNLGMWYRIAEPIWVIAWHKPAAMGRSPFGFCNWEPVLTYGKPRRRDKVDFIRAPIVADPSLNDHPCPKPLGWGVGLVSLLAAPGDKIIDPFMGSGTTMIAAKRMGHAAIGIDIDERYCEIAAKRLAQEVLPLEQVG